MYIQYSFYKVMPLKNILTFCVFFNILCKWKTTSTQWTLQNHFTLTYQQHTTELIPSDKSFIHKQNKI